MSTKPRILCVDDEENILNAIQRSLRKNYNIVTAGSGAEGLEVMATQGPFDVVVSDMKMPEMNGATFLRHAREKHPDTVRMLLTGFADLDTVVTAVNEGYIYRFLAKPCSAAVLADAIDGAVRQHQLLTSERVLLEETLKGSVRALTEILALANPAAFGRGTRISQMAILLAKAMKVSDPWQVEVAAMFSQIGCITLPHQTAMRWYNGSELSEIEQEMILRMPEVTKNVLQPIPRLEPVLDILNNQRVNFDGTGKPGNTLIGEEIPVGSRILKVCVICEELVAKGATPGNILDSLRANKGWYDPDVIDAYERVASKGGAEETIRGVTLQELRTGMVFTEDVKSSNGVLLVATGQECSESLLERIQNYADTIGLNFPMWVKNPDLPEEEIPD
jgi:response regulator RpfG family c-di-GMP phosphodiesterase